MLIGGVAAPPVGSTGPAGPARQEAASELPGSRWGKGFVLVLAALAGWAFTAGISTPWAWSDEGATYLALQRDFRQLLVLLFGPDAPLVPYYAVAKAWTGLLQAVWPGLPVVVAVRLLSALAATLTVLLLYALVAGNAGRLAGLASGLMLISLPGFVRFAQEARPYALLALMATTSWLLWDRWLGRGRPVGLWGAARTPQPRGRPEPAGAAYLASLVALGLVHTFGFFQWPAQLLAAGTRVNQRCWSRRRAVGLTLLVMAVAGIVLAAPTLLSLLEGTGSLAPRAARLVTPGTVWAQVQRAAFLSAQPQVVWLPIALAIVGVAASARWRSFASALVIWALVPFALALALGALRTNLFRSRYWIAGLPPVAALAGLGLVAVGLGVRRGLARFATSGRRWSLRTATAGAVGVMCLVLAAQVGLQADRNTFVRGPSGHGERLSGLLRVVDRTRAAHPELKVLISSASGSGILAAARPELLSGNPLRTVDPTRPTVFTVAATPSVVQARIGAGQPLLWLFRGVLPTDADRAGARLPANLAGLKLRVAWVRRAGDWTAILLVRALPTAAARQPVGPRPR